jgi:DNA polymerase III epsilon subunit-like protein
MSWTSIKNLEEIKNKKVLFIDLETTGLVKKTISNIVQEKKYPNYKENENYDSSRIVQFGYIYMKEFDYDYEIKPVNIKSIIIKPEGFEIPEETIKIHGITNKIANEKGIQIKKALKKIKKIVADTEYIIGYNIFFDINIFMNELYRKDFNKTIKKLKELKKEEKILCIGELSKQYKGYKKYMPSQQNIYKELFEKLIENIHNAQYDICATIEIMFWYYENREKFIEKIENNIMENIKKVNIDNLENENNETSDDEFPNIKLKKSSIDMNINKRDEIKKNYPNIGSKWTDIEYNDLLEELKKNEPIETICQNHGRYTGGIRKAIIRLLDNDKLIYTNELKNNYSIKYEKKNKEKLNKNKEILDDDNEIISLLVKKIESLKNKNKILKEEIEILNREKCK